MTEVSESPDDEDNGFTGRSLVLASGLGTSLLAIVALGLHHSWHSYLVWVVAIPGIALGVQLRWAPVAAFFQGALLAPFVLGLIQLLRP